MSQDPQGRSPGSPGCEAMGRDWGPKPNLLLQKTWPNRRKAEEPRSMRSTGASSLFGEEPQLPGSSYRPGQVRRVGVGALPVWETS